MDNWITSKEVAEILEVSKMTVNRWARSGKIPAIKANMDGQRVRYLFNECLIRNMMN